MAEDLAKTEQAGAARTPAGSRGEASPAAASRTPPPHPGIGVYGAPRPPVPVRLPVTRRFGGCAPGAGVGGPEPGRPAGAGAPGFRRLPPWLKVTLPGKGEYAGTKVLLRDQRLATVCEDARCPNLGHCWERGTATIMILGELCTRRCGFCAVAPGKPAGRVDWDEPRRVGEAVAAMGLRHTVITSVARDDLKDGGSTIFALVILEIRKRSDTAIEVLIPDFRGRAEDLQRVIEARPDVINHNVETVERLHPVVRPSARYQRSLEVLLRVKQSGESSRTKSGIMLGLGETDDEVLRTLQDLRTHGCDLLTIGQYLRPTPNHLPVVEYVHPDKFTWWKAHADALGFENTASGPLVRSSFHADELAGTRERGQRGSPGYPREAWVAEGG